MNDEFSTSSLGITFTRDSVEFLRHSKMFLPKKDQHYAIFFAASYIEAKDRIVVQLGFDDPKNRCVPAILEDQIEDVSFYWQISQDSPATQTVLNRIRENFCIHCEQGKPVQIVRRTA